MNYSDEYYIALNEYMLAHYDSEGGLLGYEDLDLLLLL